MFFCNFIFISCKTKLKVPFSLGIEKHWTSFRLFFVLFVCLFVCLFFFFTEHCRARLTLFTSYSATMKASRVSCLLFKGPPKRPSYVIKGNDWRHVRRSSRSIIISCKFSSIVWGSFYSRYRHRLNCDARNIGFKLFCQRSIKTYCTCI